MEIAKKIYYASSVWIDYKGLQVITEWSKSKANKVFKQLQRECKCANPFDSRLARTETILAKLGYEKDKLVSDLKYQIEIERGLNIENRNN